MGHGVFSIFVYGDPRVSGMTGEGVYMASSYESFYGGYPLLGWWANIGRGVLRGHLGYPQGGVFWAGVIRTSRSGSAWYRGVLA
jgi:hypothetical protein